METERPPIADLVKTQFGVLLDSMRTNILEARAGQLRPELKGEDREEYFAQLAASLVKLAGEGAATICEQPFVITPAPELAELHVLDAALVTLEALEAWVSERYLDGMLASAGPTDTAH